MILPAIGAILPLAVAMALSSVPVMATIAILMSPRRARAALPFLVGSVLGLAVVVVVFAAGASVIPEPGPIHSETVKGVGLILLGAALVVVAIVLWRRDVEQESESTPKWMSALNSAGRWTAFGVALGLGLRPKSLLVSAAVGLSLRGLSLSWGDSAIVLAVYLVIASSSIVVPIVLTLAAPERAEAPLRATRAWLIGHSRVITMVILLLVGVVVIGDGLGRL